MGTQNTMIEVRLPVHLPSIDVARGNAIAEPALWKVIQQRQPERIHPKGLHFTQSNRYHKLGPHVVRRERLMMRVLAIK
jgi:hypothetical protein